MPENAFDSAAPMFDAGRAFPPGIAELVAAEAWALAPAARTWVELGAGTGRITRPLLAQGAKVIGLDRSAGMLAALRAQLPPGATLRLAYAEVSVLPLAAAVADVVVAVHVLQLIANWRAVIAESRRVLRPGGALLLGYEWRPPNSPGARLRSQWDVIIRAHGGLPGQPGGVQPDFDDMRAALMAEGACLVERQVGDWVLTRTLARHLETIEHRTWSPSWGAPPAFFAACLAELRAWAVTQFGPLETAFVVPHRFVWQRYTWPA